MSENLVLKQYISFPREITVNIDSWKNIIENSPAHHAVCWIYKSKSNGDMSTFNEEGQPMPKRAYKSRAGVQAEDESSKSQPIQKPSKKIGCRCYITVTCYFVTPNQVTIKLHNEHNHLIGSLDDISFLPLSDNTKEVILQELREDYGRRDIRAAIHCHFNERIRDLFSEAASSSSSSVYAVHRDQFVHSEDVYNIYRKIQELSYKKHNERDPYAFLTYPLTSILSPIKTSIYDIIEDGAGNTNNSDDDCDNVESNKDATSSDVVGIGYARKSVAKEIDVFRSHLLQLMVDKLHFRLKCQEVYVSSCCAANDTNLNRDSPSFQTIHASLKGCQGASPI
ncbi:hypothetical protein BCV72DRAFT_262886 [Rhizopus microsporus var. microsporus]|uniref:FAR1 domain-containing protein n=2 Tax=Rhizopus microsporus TaxID=58291 RepID=A0A2G4T109_RHIZD|nr:uncharacterized protein RHIMIDRAFT_290363 [Rhizopus microsporus ATCC 52813]ORE06196.1 hypothetical protein BCV72DRAFT_262886 [Rhizopus microsporus var. microsporus]PHZ14703.1 hypothetical protein RHIMIDRAFT_290363 [Rhizopus microsporus ATCC 52813]